VKIGIQMRFLDRIPLILAFACFQGCAPLYYPVANQQQGQSAPYSNTYPNTYQPAYPQNYTVNYPQSYPNSSYPPNSTYQPAVVVVKSCECPPQGLGFVRIHSAPPFASVYVNGKAEGETPLEYLSIPAGKAHIELIHRQFGPSDTIIEVRPGQKIDLKMHLAQYSDDEEEDE
jgi:PEGA domain